MKLLRTINYVVVIVAFIISVLIAVQVAGTILFLVPIPFVIMLGLLKLTDSKTFSEPSRIAFFIASLIVCIISTLSYFEATFTSTSSTRGLVFFRVPFSSLFIMAIIFALSRAIIILIWYRQNDKNAWRTILITIAVVFILPNLFSIHALLGSTSQEERDEVSLTKGDILRSKKLGVFVKDLHYRVDSFTGPVSFAPYIEKAFRYLDDDSTKIEIIKDRLGSYSIGFQKKAVGDGMLETVNYHECEYMPCLKKPKLEDTIVFNIKRLGYIVGTIKVWD